MTISVKLDASLHDVDRSQWDALAGPGDFYVSSTGLAIYEKLYPREPGYLSAIDDGAQVAALAWYLLDEESRASPFTRPDRLLARLLEERGHAIAEPDLYPVLPALLCGGRQAGPTRLLRARGQAGKRIAWLGAVLAAICQHAADIDASSLCMPYVDRADTELCDALEADGWMKFPTDHYYLLQVTWRDFDGYLKTVPSKRQRSIRRELAKLGEQGVKIDSEPVDDGLITEMADLAVNLKRRHGSPRTSADIAESIAAFIGQANGGYLLTTARYQNRLVGYGFCFRWRDELYARDAGFDYELQDALNVSLYFPTLFYEAARISPELGVDAIHYGLGSGQAKTSRGCLEIQDFGYFKPLTEAAASVLRHCASFYDGS